MTIDMIKESYLNWIRENTTFTGVLDDSIEISTPFVDSLNENIKIYIESHSDRFKITDDGYTIWDLESSGMSFRKGSRREKILYDTLDRFSVSINPSNNELYVHSKQKDLGKMIHIFIQTVLSISDMLKYNKAVVKNIFYEEVNEYFEKNDDIYDKFSDFEIQGKSKLLHRFDYLMTVKDKQKKLVRLINNLNQVQLERTVFSWEDTSKQRAAKYKENLGMVVLINDSDKKIPSNFKEAFIEYGIEPVGFSNKKEVKKSLSLVE